MPINFKSQITTDQHSEQKDARETILRKTHSFGTKK